MLGLKHGTVILCMHEKEWETEAQNSMSEVHQFRLLKLSPL